MRTFLWILVLGMAAAAGRASEPVDLNRASVAELMGVPGMTAVWAGRIVRFRPYRTKLGLLDKGVVTAEVYGRIKDGVVAHRVVQGEAKAGAKKRTAGGDEGW